MRPESQAARTARLEAENAVLTVAARRLTEERDIVRQSTKYFAGQNW